MGGALKNVHVDATPADPRPGDNSPGRRRRRRRMEIMQDGETVALLPPTPSPPLLLLREIGNGNQEATRQM